MLGLPYDVLVLLHRVQRRVTELGPASHNTPYVYSFKSIHLVNSLRPIGPLVSNSRLKQPS